MGEIFRAPEEDWAEIESLSKEKFGCAYKGLCDLRDRVAALETARRAEVELLNAAHAQQQATVKESLTAEPAPADPEDREWITDRCPVLSETNFYGWVEVPASCRSSQPITEDGRRYTEYYLIDKGDPWLPASADYYNSRRALFDSGYKKGLEAGRAERRQEAATEESSAAHSEPANPDAPAPTEPAPPAPAGGLVEELVEEIMRKVPGSKEEEIKWTLGVVAEWSLHEIELDSIDFAAFLSRMEAIR